MKKSKSTTKQKKNQRIAIIAIIVVLILVIAWKMRSKSSKTETVPGTTTTYKSSSSTLPKLGNDATLKKGTKSQEVAWVQAYYNEKVAIPLKKTKLVVDGIDGTKTTAAIKSVTGSTSTTWTIFKRTIDGTSSAPTASIYTNDWQNDENQWPWETQS